MKITIFDLDRLREFRRSELTANINHQHSQLFSFDGLLSSTWFAIRIDYRLLYYQTANIDTGDAGGFQDFPTKQELIVQTKNETSMSSPSSTGHEELGGHKRRVYSSSITSTPPYTPQCHYIYSLCNEVKAYHPDSAGTSLSSWHPKTASCTSTQPGDCLIRPQENSWAQHPGSSIYPVLHQPQQTEYHNPSHTVYLDKGGSSVKCYQLCIFPFIRADILEHGQQTFRGKEFCDSIDVARQLAFQHHNKHRHHAPKLRSPFSTRELSSNFEGEWSLSPSSACIIISSTNGSEKGGYCGCWSSGLAAARHAVLYDVEPVVFELSKGLVGSGATNQKILMV
uniref:Uncharacterized protein n=1 Tax=Ditylenchus dipsaci TaxID=166011 RepID=A0A915DI55_9BILA